MKPATYARDAIRRPPTSIWSWPSEISSQTVLSASSALRIGDTAELAYVDQSRDTLGGNNTVWQEISGGQDEIDLGRRK
ncbi:MAG TPA: hypothetical protein VHG31_06580, partial [Stellaceae bacterium]|nr:hypothetical protein [Stellaceae bacterium]